MIQFLLDSNAAVYLLIASGVLYYKAWQLAAMGTELDSDIAWHFRIKATTGIGLVVAYLVFCYLPISISAEGPLYFFDTLSPWIRAAFQCLCILLGHSMMMNSFIRSIYFNDQQVRVNKPI